MKPIEEYYLRLNNFLYDSPKKITEILNTYPTFEEFKENISLIQSKIKLPKNLATNFNSILTNFDIELFLNKLNKLNIKYITINSPLYPKQLKEISDSPPILYYQGNPELLNHSAISIVGTRKYTEYGQRITQELVKHLSKYFVIVSGLARGIDTIAHKTALQHRNSTIGVIGTGLNVIYPSENKKLYEQMRSEGLIISEFPPEIQGLPYRFPQRNRIVSGLSLGTVVCEAKEKSGALITANMAAEQGREVFAVPGNIFSENSQGPHKLILEGAKLVRNPQDIIDELNIQLQLPLDFTTPINHKPKPKSDNPDENTILSLINSEPMTTDELSIKANFSIPHTLQLLTTLELKEQVKTLSGNRWCI